MSAHGHGVGESGGPGVCGQLRQGPNRPIAGGWWFWPAHPQRFFLPTHRLTDSPRIVPAQQVAGATEAGLVAQSAETQGAKRRMQVILDRVLAQVVAVADLP